MAKGSGHDKSPARACRARPARAADSPRFAPHPALSRRDGASGPSGPAPCANPLCLSNTAAASGLRLVSPAQAALIRSAVPSLPTKPEERLCGGPIRAKSARLRFLASPLLPQKQKAFLRGPQWLERNRFRQYTTSWGKSTAFFVEWRSYGAFHKKFTPKAGRIRQKETRSRRIRSGTRTAPGACPGPGCHPFSLASSASMARNTGIMPILSGVWAGIW